MARAKIGVVVATYNSARTLRQCMDSIQEQSFKDIDIYIQDGGSVDGTLDIIKEYEVARFSSEKDSGVYNAWNKGLEKINADWIIFLGSDDYLTSPLALSSVIGYLDAASEQGVKVVYGKNILVDESGKFISEIGVPWQAASVGLRKKMTIRHPGCFHHVSLFDRIGGFDETYKVIGDYHFILRALERADAEFYPFSIVSHRVGGLSNKPSLMMSVVKENLGFERN